MCCFELSLHDPSLSLYKSWQCKIVLPWILKSGREPPIPPAFCKAPSLQVQLGAGLVCHPINLGMHTEGRIVITWRNSWLNNKQQITHWTRFSVLIYTFVHQTNSSPTMWGQFSMNIWRHQIKWCYNWHFDIYKASNPLTNRQQIFQLTDPSCHFYKQKEAPCPFI